MAQIYGKKKSKFRFKANCKKLAQLLFNPRILLPPILGLACLVAALSMLAVKLSSLEPVDMMTNFTNGGVWDDAFELNDILTNVRMIRTLKVFSPRCLVFDYGSQVLFVGQVDGTVLGIEKDQYGRVGMGDIKLVSSYPGYIISMRISMGMLYVGDADHGIYIIELSSMKRIMALELHEVNPPVKSLMDFTIGTGGLLYVVDSSSKYSARKYMHQFLEGSCTGRLFRFSPVSKRVINMKDGLCMPTSVEATFTEDGLLISESGRGRLIVWDIDNTTVRSETYLPGIPGRIRLNRRGGYWMTMQAVNHGFLKYVNDRSWLRKVLCFLLPEKILWGLAFTPHHAAVDLHTNGTVMASLQDQYGKNNDRITDIAEAENEVLFFGNDNQNFMGGLGDPQPQFDPKSYGMDDAPKPFDMGGSGKDPTEQETKQGL
ncbi:adipocyte plasma membrane-associated protein-like [Ciona intestinalis]